ncbi:MAG: hypothetical protein U5J97_02520 [Trueperaceae bacterium]|nr:hypothetical protein [Trueperaceae bacterium]
MSLEQCHGTCLRLEDCAGFTFDQRNGACFPKAVVGDPVAFEGALSGVITRRDEVALERAREVAARLDFLESDDVGAAREQAISMAERYAAGGRSQAELLEAARRAPSEAVTWTGAAVTVADDGAAWLAHARALVAEAGRDANRRYELDRQAVSAALNAVLRLPEPERAQALVVLAHALEETYRGEAALGALRLADGMRPGIAAGDLARLRERFGFRVLGHDVDASSAAPRICVSFSEQLSPRRDYAPFVGRDVQGLALEVEGQELCVTGVAYGESYRLTLRAGLPSAGGDALTGDVPVEVYVRDRAPVVRFPGRAYVLPASGPRALPIETVNADRLELRLLRVSDRNLATAVRDGSFAEALSTWEGERFEELLAEPVWQGEAQLEGTLNQSTPSRLPLDEVGELEPGVYVLRAVVPDTDPFDVAPATQWFMVSDLGVTTLAGHRRAARRRAAPVRRPAGGRPAGHASGALQPRPRRRADRPPGSRPLRGGAHSGRRRGGSCAGAGRGRRRHGGAVAGGARVRPVGPRRVGARGPRSHRPVPHHRPRRLPARRDDPHNRPGPRPTGTRPAWPAAHGAAAAARRHRGRPRRVP